MNRYIPPTHILHFSHSLQKVTIHGQFVSFFNFNVVSNIQIIFCFLLQHILSICKYYYIQIYFLSKIGVLQLQFLIFMYILLLLVLKCKNTTTILLWKLESRNSSDSSQKALFLHHYKVRNININLFKSICSLKFWRKKNISAPSRRHLQHGPKVNTE